MSQETSIQSATVAPAKKYIPPSLRRKMAAEADGETSSCGPVAPSSRSNMPAILADPVPAPRVRQLPRELTTGGGRSGPGTLGMGARRGLLSESQGVSRKGKDGAWVVPGRIPDKLNLRELFGNPQENTGGTVYRDITAFDGIPVTLDGDKSETFEAIEEFTAGIAATDGTPVQHGLHPLVLENVKRIGYVTPSPVQRWSVPVMLSGRDLMACSQTGSGKTAGFLCPIITSMLNKGPPQPDTGADIRSFSSFGLTGNAQTPSALCMSPTRELATQIFEEARKFTYKTGIRAVVIYGGSPSGQQIRDMERGCDICIGTPGRILDLVDRGCMNMTKVQHFVLDEADRMLDMGFAPQIEQVVETTGMPNKRERQTVMFSATFPKPIQKMAANFMKDYLYLTIGRVGATNECIQQEFVFAKEADKPKQLIELLNSVDGLTLIFVDTKRRCDSIASFLNDYNIGAVSIHGDKTQADREFALKLFKTGQASVMVATDVASRGLDINNVAHVINVDVPSNIDDYVHRIGRTGRAGNKGLATSLVNENNSGVIRDLVKVLNDANQTTPKFLLDMVSSRSRTGGAGGGGSTWARRRY